jgi:cytochrome c553
MWIFRLNFLTLNLILGVFWMKKILVNTLATLAVSLSTTVFAEGEATVDVAAGKEIATKVCVACHGADGNSAVPTFPKLAGQHSSYTSKQLHDFKSGARVDPVMTAQAKTLSDVDIANVSAYFASQKIKLGNADAAKIALGESIYRGGNTKTNVTACASCHNPKGEGNAAAKFPALSGQHQTYTKKQLNDFKKEGGRSNDPASIMRNIAMNMSDKEIDAVAEYITAVH